MISNEILERIRVLPPQQQAQVGNLIKINQAKADMRQKASDMLDNFMQSKAVSNFVGISGENIK